MHNFEPAEISPE